MKKQKQDTQKAADLLKKLQEAVLSSQKKDDRSEAPDQDELEFQKRIAGMLSRVTPQSEAVKTKKKKKTATRAQSAPVIAPIEENGESVADEILPPTETEAAVDEAVAAGEIIEKTAVEEPVAEEPVAEEPVVEEPVVEETVVKEADPLPNPVKKSKRTRAKKQALHQKSVIKTAAPADTEPPSETEVEPDVADVLTEQTENIPTDELSVEEPAIEEKPIEENLAAETSSVEKEPLVRKSPAEENTSVQQQPVAKIVKPTIPKQPAAPPKKGKPMSNRPAIDPKKNTVRVISPKPVEPHHRDKDPNTIVITPKSNLKSTVPIVIKPKRSERTAEPIRVEVKETMPKAPKAIPSPSSEQKSPVTPKKGSDASTNAASAKAATSPRRTTPVGSSSKRSAGVSAPRVPRNASGASGSRSSGKQKAVEKRNSAVLENVLFDNSSSEIADADFSMRRSAASGSAYGKSSPAAFLSTQEILKYTERKTGLSPDDVSMILELGYDQELSNLIGRDALKKLKAEHVREKRPTDKLHYLTSFGYRNQEYTGEHSRDVILANYVHDKKALILRLALTALITLLLLPMELPMLFAGLFPMGFEKIPVILLPLLSLMGLILATLISHKCVRAGIRSFFRISPSPYSIAGLLCMIAIPTGMVNLFLAGGEKTLISLNLPAVGTLLVTAICDAARLASEMKVFRIISVDEEKTVMETAEPQKQKIRQGDKIVQIINDDVDLNIYCVRKSNFITGFFRRCNDSSSAVRPFGFLLLTALTLSFLTGFTSAVFGKDVATVASASLLTFFISLPVPAVVLFFYPLCRANRLLNHRNCALIGEESIAEFGRNKTVIYRDKDMFTIKKCTQTMIREGEDFRRDMHLAAILFRRMRGALSDLDPHSAEKALSDPPVTFVRLGENGTEAMVDNRYHLLAGDGKFMVKNGVRIPEERTESAAQRKENVCLMYLAINGVLKLTYEIEYEASPSFESMAALLAEHNTRLAIRTYDPNLNDAFMEQSRDSGVEYIRVIKPVRNESDGTMEISDNGVVALGGRFDLPRTMIAASVINTIRSYGYRIQFVAAILGAALTMLHTFLYPDLPSGFSLLIALLFQGIFTAVAWLATRLIFRFGSSENLK